MLREYIKENFVDKGMIADLSIHDKGDGNKILLGYHTKNYLPKPTPDKEEITQLLEK